jgi:hypothetical protein
MTPKITDEQRRAIEAHPGEPVRVEDDKTHRTYILVEESRAPKLHERWLRQQLEAGFDAAARGEFVAWDPDRIKDEGRRRLADTPPAS